MRCVRLGLLFFAACGRPEAQPADSLASTIPRAAPCTGATAIAFSPPGAQKLADVTSVAITVTPSRTCRPEAVSLELVSPKNSPFEVRKADLKGARSVTFRFPVAGTTIAQRGLYGPWKVRAFIDGAALPPAGFDLDR